MGKELKFAMKCRASRKRPIIRRHCAKCVQPTVSTYVPDNVEVYSSENSIKQMIETR